MTPANIAALFATEDDNAVTTPQGTNRLARPRNRVASMSGIGAMTLRDYLRQRRDAGQPAAESRED